MELIKLAVKLVFTLIFIFFTLIFGIREYLIAKTSNIVGNDYRRVFKSYSLDNQGRKCKQKFGDAGVKTGRHIYQLRFIDKKRYVTEVICNALSNQTIVIKEVQLPLFVTHSPIGSGFVANLEEKSELVGFRVFDGGGSEWQRFILSQLSFFRKDFYLVKSKHKLEKKTAYEPSVDAGVQGPKTTCAGYGFSCCDPVTSVGQGLSRSDATDCKNSCFISCKPRPIILGFNASLNFNHSLREVSLNSDEEVAFAVVVYDNGLEVAGVELDFGDGQSAKLTGLGPFEVTHSYFCNQAICSYTARVRAFTVDGVSSYNSPVSRITVKVRR